MPHSCRVVGLDAFFAGAAPALRAVFDRFVAAAGAGGPVTVNATKSRVTLQVRMRFAGIDRPRKAHLVANFVLTRPVESPRLMGVEALAPYYYVHRLRLRAPADVDVELGRWLAEAYQVGTQRHLSDPDWVRVPVSAGRAAPPAPPRGMNAPRGAA